MQLIKALKNERDVLLKDRESLEGALGEANSKLSVAEEERDSLKERVMMFDELSQGTPREGVADPHDERVSNLQRQLDEASERHEQDQVALRTIREELQEALKSGTSMSDNECIKEKSSSGEIEALQFELATALERQKQLESQLDEANASKEAVNVQSTKLEQELSTLRSSQVKDHTEQDKTSTLLEELTAAQREVERLATGKQKVESELEKVTESLRASQENANELAQEVKGLREELISAPATSPVSKDDGPTKEREDLASIANQEALVKINEELSSLQTQLEMVRKEKEAAESAVQALQDNVERFNTGLAQAQIILEESCGGDASEASNAPKVGHEALQQFLEATLASLNQRETELASTRTHLEDALSREAKALERCTVLEVSVTRAEEKADAATSEVENLRAEAEKELALRSAAEAEHNRCREQVDQLSTQLGESLSKIDSLTLAHASAEEKVEECNAAMTSAKLQAEALAKEVTQKQFELDTLQQTVESLEATASSLRESMELGNAKVMQSESDLNELKAAVAETEVQLAAMNEKYQAQTLEYKALQGTLDKCRQDFDKCKQESEQVSKELLAKQERVDAAEDALRETKSALQTAESKVVSLLEGTGKTEWRVPEQDCPCPPFNVDHPAAQAIFAHWSNDKRKVEFVDNWFRALSEPGRMPAQPKLELNNVASEVVQGFHQILVPIARKARPELQIAFQMKLEQIYSIRLEATVL